MHLCVHSAELLKARTYTGGQFIIALTQKEEASFPQPKGNVSYRNCV